MRRRVPDLERITSLIGYSPQYTLEQTLKRVIVYERERFVKQSKEPTLPRPSR
jgi:hypothetical protein